MMMLPVLMMVVLMVVPSITTCKAIGYYIPKKAAYTLLYIVPAQGS
jgi:hypothetical protein